MKVCIISYPLDDLFFQHPIIYEKTYPGILPCDIKQLYNSILHHFMNSSPIMFRGKAVAIKPFTLIYSAGVEGRIIMHSTPMWPSNDLSGLPWPRRINGEYYVTFLTNYKFI